VAYELDSGLRYQRYNKIFVYAISVIPNHWRTVRFVMHDVDGHEPVASFAVWF
jgi:hypothetical protein